MASDAAGADPLHHRLTFSGGCRRRGIGVNDGTRTRDRQGHNLELYQLSYVHHRQGTEWYHRRGSRETLWRARQDSNLRPED